MVAEDKVAEDDHLEDSHSTDIEPGFKVEQVALPGKKESVHVVVIDVSHLVDGPVLDALQSRLAALQAEHPRLDLLIDVGCVDMMSSPAIGLLGMAHRKLWNSKGRMKLCAVRPNVMHVFTLTRLAGIFDIYGTREQAMASF